MKRLNGDHRPPICHAALLDAVRVTQAANQALARGDIQAYYVVPQDNGIIAMTESVIGTYPKGAAPLSAAPIRVYQASSSNAGDLAATALKRSQAVYDRAQQRLVVSARPPPARRRRRAAA